MPEMKGITVKIPADLHAEVKAYLEAHGMTMGEFIAQAVDNELHPKIQITQEDKNMERMRTLAFQVPDSLFQRVKAYLERNHMTQKQFVIGLIEQALEEAEEEFEAVRAAEYEEQQAEEDWESGEESEGWNEESSETEESENEEEPAEGSPSESYDENSPQEDEVEIENQDENENTEETGETNENEEETYA